LPPLPPEELSPAALLRRLFSGLKAAGAKSQIKDLGLTAGDWFAYLFDFGDEWWHVIGKRNNDLLSSRKTQKVREEINQFRHLAGENQAMDFFDVLARRIGQFLLCV